MGDYLELKLAGGQTEQGVLYVALTNAAMVGEGYPPYVARKTEPSVVYTHQVMEPCPPSMFSKGIVCIHRYILYKKGVPDGEEIYLL